MKVPNPVIRSTSLTKFIIMEVIVGVFSLANN